MSLVRPFAGLRPAPSRAGEVAAPPYDVLTTTEARARAAGRPWSFLHISKPEIDLPAGTDPHAPAVYAKATENLQRMLAEGVLVRDRGPRYYAYTMVTEARRLTGIVVAASVAEYDRNRVRRHELTRPDKEDDRVAQIEALNAQTGPVQCAYPAAPELDALIGLAAASAPDCEVEADGVRHAIHPIEDATTQEHITRRFDALPAIYIGDGHHRSAAASRVAARRRAAIANPTGDESHEWFLSVVFPHHQMTIRDYNRVVRDLAGMTLDQFLERLRERYVVEPSSGPVRPTCHGEVGLYTGGRWLRLAIRPDLAEPAGAIARLDVTLLSEHILGPVLGIGDQRTDLRIDFVGGGRGLEGLVSRVDSGEMAAAFALYPTRFEDLIAVADAGAVMPPKSTWFEPKLLDGLVSHVLD